jgi:hypothetical protein
MSLSLLPNNQVEQRGHDCGFALCEDDATTKCYCGMPGASAYLPDVPQQRTELIELAKTVRESVRVLESGKHGS